MGLIKNVRNKDDIKFQYLSCDNAGEYVDFERACRKEGLGMGLEYTATNTPQQNGCI